MNRCGVACALMLLLAFQPGAPAQAGFPEAFKAYSEGHYEEARAEFLELAQLGSAASQFDMGAMALHGQGGPKDLGAAVGWLTAAADNGDTQLPPEKLAAVRATLSDEQLRTADDIVSRYGRAGLAKTVLPVPPPQAHCRNLTPARLVHTPEPDPEYYPRGGRLNDQNGFVIVQLIVGIDGEPRDPEILMAVPGPEFSAAAVDLWMRSRWTPASRDGAAVESKVSVKAVFRLIGGGLLWDLPALKAIRETALRGDPKAQYQIGLAAMLDGSLGIPSSQALTLLVLAAQGGHPPAQYWVANRFMSVGDCGVEDKKLPWLRAAAHAGDGAAQLALAESLISSQPTPQQIAAAKALLEQAAQSDNFYVMKHVAALLATSSFEQLRDASTARAVADRLMKDPIEADPQKYEAAAAAYAMNRDFWLAAAKEQAAIKEATRLQWDTRRMQERFTLYHSSRSWAGDVFAPPTAPPAGSAAASPTP
jgi:TPR repeat protein